MFGYFLGFATPFITGFLAHLVWTNVLADHKGCSWYGILFLLDDYDVSQECGTIRSSITAYSVGLEDKKYWTLPSRERTYPLQLRALLKMMISWQTPFGGMSLLRFLGVFLNVSLTERSWFLMNPPWLQLPVFVVQVRRFSNIYRKQ